MPFQSNSGTKSGVFGTQSFTEKAQRDTEKNSVNLCVREASAVSVSLFSSGL